MIIGFLADKIPYEKRRGWGVYSYHLLRELLNIDRENTYRCFYNIFKKGDRKLALNVPGSKVENSIWPIPGRLMEILWERWNILSVENFLGPVDVFHTPYEFLPKVRSAKTVVTVHDVTFLKHPEFLETSFIKLFTRRIQHIKERADKIIADSYNTKNELIELTGIDKKRVEVIFPGVDAIFRPVENRERIKSITSHYGISGPYILFVGAADEDKNLVRLVESFSQLSLQEKHLQLVFAGNPDMGHKRLQEKFHSLYFKERIVFTGFIADSDLPALYSGAKALAIPSIHEGFGFPALEAMACGTPVLCSNTSSLPEVVGEAAVMVDPYNTEEITGNLERLVEDEDLRRSCIVKGLSQAKKFTWEITARRTLDLYKELIK